MLKQVRNRFTDLVRSRSPYRSQVGQDQWVVETLGGKRNGYFVEIGAADGVTLSNSYGLERALGWNGICIEPNPSDFALLRRNRRCKVVQALASSKVGLSLDFQVDGSLSGVRQTAGGMMRDGQELISLKSTTLALLLEENNAPDVIDYLSLDVEGHEIDVLRGLFPGQFRFRCITVEHNEPHQGPALRVALREMLSAHGYQFVKGNDDIRGWGHGPIDDFYVSVDAALLPKQG